MIRLKEQALAAILAITTWAGSSLAEPRAEIVAPRQLQAPELRYPTGAHGDGEVIVEIEVAQDGTVTRAAVKAGAPPFHQEALHAARSFRFEPATRNGIPVRARVLAQLVFREPIPEPRPAAAPVPAVPAGTSRGPVAATRSAPPTAQPIEITVLGEEREELGSIHIPRSEARLVPGAFADPFRVVEVLPGVAPIVNGLPYFFVRGAPPGDVGYFIDGIRVPLLFHVGAGPSVLAPALVDRVDLFPSAYPARFGRVVGGVMAGETLPPSQTARGEAQARVFDAGALVESPFGDGRGSVLLAGRYSYTQALLSLVAPAYQLGYGDYQARIAYAVSPRDRLSLFAFGAFDRLANDRVQRTLFDVQFHRIDLRWDHLTESGSVRVAATLSGDRVANAEEDTPVPGSRLSTDGARLRMELDQKLSRSLRVRAGADLGLERMGTEQEQQGPNVAVFPARTDVLGGAYADAVWRPGPGVELVPGVRLDARRLRDASFVRADPRLATRVKIAEGVSWVAAFGVAHQLPSDNVRIPGGVPTAMEQLPQEAWQVSQGVEAVLPWSMLAKLTLFRTWIDAEDAHLIARNQGLELFLRRDFTERLGGFFSYTFSRAERSNGPFTVRADSDRTHVISAVLGYDMGHGFRVGSRAYYSSGRPYQVACPNSACGPGDPAAPRPFLATGVLPGFFRLDIRFEKRWTFASGSWVAANFEWFNALMRPETTQVKWTPAGLTRRVLDPITLPSVGIEAGF